MKRKLMAAGLWAIAAIAASVPAFALAQTAPADPDQPGLTRAQVMADLIGAEREGLVPTTDGDYPPSDRTVARNRELYAIAHGERSSMVGATSREAQ
ncbi:DUF4148 domain-containing protein [Burkholderia guangdongensis]|uniref:DUF4148 domain-containing protein n=1 Tax=Burkholderia guangdongensis TaxID=1792500 RepID=UPI0015CA67DB|nr:DUF4148 domain-containing protein [Burkholderia guangdongensis]